MSSSGASGRGDPSAAAPEAAIRVDGIGKSYQIYDTPRDRLKQFIAPRLQRLAGRAPRRYFHEFWALRDVSFEVRKGETVGIIGRNGSGKSTLLQIICGTLAPTTGEVRASGRIAALLELGSGFNPEFTGRENVYLNAAILGLDEREIEARFDDIAAFAEIGPFIEQPVKTYSSGMVVRLAFAVAINVDPEILVVDEALSVGDERFQRKCFARIEAIKRRGATILFVSHSGSTVVELCDRVVLLDDGEKLAVGAPKPIVGRYQKLLYATSERRAAIREEIRTAEGARVAAGPDRPSPGLPEGADAGAGGAGEADEAAVGEGPQESYDESLRPSSTIEYEPRGARLEGPAVRTLRGERVNNLVRGRTYRYEYTVRFTRSASNVRFGMLIKTVSGVELGGGVSAAGVGDSIAIVEAGAVYRVAFRFRCALNPGVYFLNAGFVGDIDGTEGYLHRLVDAAMFRVLPETKSLSSGTVDFGCVPTVERLDLQA
jgi:lipopolysaccharide transport system ATP-binding protein